MLGALHVRSVVLAVCLLSMSACAMKCGDYRYFKFQPDTGAQVTETRSPSLEGLKDVKPFPISYRIQRVGYRLILRADETTYGPTTKVVIESSDSKSLRLIPSPNTSVLGTCVSYKVSGDAVTVAWLDRQSCETHINIDLEVLSANGTQIAVEKLPLEVITNGQYCVTDAL